MKYISLSKGAIGAIEGGANVLDAVRAAAEPFAEEDVARAVIVAANALHDCIDFGQAIESDARVVFNSFRGEDGRLDRELAAAERTTTGVTYQDRANAVGAERAKIVTNAAADAYARAIAARQATVDQLGRAAFASMQALRNAILVAEAKYNGPIAFREKLSMADITTVATIRETEGATRRPTELAQMFEGLILAGDTKQENLFAAAIESELRTMIALSQQALRTRLGVGGPHSSERANAIERERSAASDLLRRLEQRREELVPQSLAIAREAEQALLGAFRALIGEHAMSMSPREFETYKTGPRHPLKISAKWPQRLALAFWDDDDRSPTKPAPRPPARFDREPSVRAPRTTRTR